MSHYSVLVHLPKSDGTDIQVHLGAAMAPFIEQVDADSPYAEFTDETDKVVEEFETKTEERVFLKSGKNVSLYDEECRNPNHKWSIDRGADNEQYIVPEGATKFETPIKNIYPSVVHYAKTWHGYKSKVVDGQTRFGYFTNPNAKWDWFVVGGRWSDAQWQLLPNNQAPARELPYLYKAGMKRAREEAADFVQEWGKYIGYPTFDGFEGPRSRAMKLGLCKVVQGPATAGPNQVAVPWTRVPNLKEDDSRRSWNDVLTIPDAGFIDREVDFFHKMRPYAFLDAKGRWNEPGRMGWWGAGSDHGDELTAYRKAFQEWVQSLEGQPGMVVMVDCHI